MLACLKPFFVWASVISGFIAAGLWIGATIVKVPYKRGTVQSTMVETDEETGEETDIFNTARRQTQWNRWAAAFTAISALCQAISLMLR
jgi:hypothetical protein